MSDVKKTHSEFSPTPFTSAHSGYYTTTESIHLHKAFLECIRNDSNCQQPPPRFPAAESINASMKKGDSDSKSN